MATLSSFTYLNLPGLDNALDFDLYICSKLEPCSDCAISRSRYNLEETRLNGVFRVKIFNICIVLYFAKPRLHIAVTIAEHVCDYVQGCRRRSGRSGHGRTRIHHIQSN